MNDISCAQVCVRRSRPGLGLGLFAVENIEPGYLIGEYMGARTPTFFADTLKTKYLFALDDDWTIDGAGRDNLARYINHSCDPNSEAEVHDGRVYILAMRAIAVREEITIDYGDEYFDEFIRPSGCKCSKCASG
jgi:SET domain-containing protein